ncbi:cytochrome P450 [Nocardia sp. XZ_19_369]|uniref:cytochrome P450 n=1 Tax=Nocardia sp. XZ_19_369 TaxID=2769487 RepID=UPI00188F23D6|nr:cytochrome P450 [Nocardia sp. XZ_19_369]
MTSVDEFSLHHPPGRADELFEWFSALRSAGRVQRNDRDGLWHVFGYDECVRVLSDHTDFSSYLAPAEPDPADDLAYLVPGSFVLMDPPKHRGYRALTTDIFNPRLAGLLERQTEQAAHDLIDRLPRHGTFDVLNDFSMQLVIPFTSRLLGLPETEHRMFCEHFQTALQVESEPAGENRLDDLLPSTRRIRDFLFDHVTRSRRGDATGLTKLLTTADIDGRAMPDDEIVGLLALLLRTGQGAMLSVANAVLCLDDNPTAMVELRDDPGLIPGAVEESLRYRSQSTVVVRKAVREVELAGHTIAKGAGVALWLAAANRDEQEFDRPAVFDIHRAPNRHLGFGHGVHFCLGAGLARMQTAVALRVLLERTRSLVVDRAAVRHCDPRWLMSVYALPVRAELIPR